jgi:hypothetical protein
MASTHHTSPAKKKIFLVLVVVLYSTVEYSTVVQYIGPGGFSWCKQKTASPLHHDNNIHNITHQQKNTTKRRKKQRKRSYHHNTHDNHKRPKHHCQNDLSSHFTSTSFLSHFRRFDTHTQKNEINTFKSQSCRRGGIRLRLVIVY